MAKEKKALNTKVYAVVVFFLVAAILATITVVTYKSKYTGFSPEKVAIAFTDTIVSRGDGYNAYKNALMSKNYKYGDFIREHYMYPVIYAENGYKPGDNRDNLKGLNDESYMGEKTKSDTGALAGQVIKQMEPYYNELVSNLNGWDDYDTFFKEYFKKLVEVRQQIFGDKYMTDEIMFTALEANVSAYGDILTGTDEVIDEETNIKTEEKTVGVYEKIYGENYRFTYEVVKSEKAKTVGFYKKDCDTVTFGTYKVDRKDISDAQTVTVDVKVNGEKVATQIVTVVKINSTWYVDNTRTDTTSLYSFYK